MLRRFEFYNPNPVNPTAGDCVIRAICKATGEDWKTVYAKLSVEGMSKGEWANDNEVWDGYLLSLGYTRQSIPNTCPNCYTIAQFADDNPTGCYIVATGSHVATIIDSVLYDSYDSSKKVPLYYYTKEQ